MEALLSIIGGGSSGIMNFYNSNFFGLVKFLFGIYAVVLLADIILLLVQRGLSGDIRDTLYGMDIPPELVDKKTIIRKKWNTIREKMKDKNESAWKIAIIEADSMIDDLIKRMGYPGENMGERLSKIKPGQIENIEELKKSHEMRNRIIQEENYKLSKEEAKEFLGYYENFLHYFEVL